MNSDESDSRKIVFVFLLASLTLVFSFLPQSRVVSGDEEVQVTSIDKEGETFLLAPNKVNFTPKIIKVTVTAYTSRPEETDSTPFITASGEEVKMGIVASNFLPMGTEIKIPAVFGDKIFRVEDRMNPRYKNRIDIWLPSLEEAKKFGVKKTEILIL